MLARPGSALDIQNENHTNKKATLAGGFLVLGPAALRFAPGGLVLR